MRIETAMLNLEVNLRYIRGRGGGLLKQKHEIAAKMKQGL
jgi:hypothetical protein